MCKKLVLAIAFVLLAGIKVGAADSELQQIADALDVSTTKTFQFTANGTMYSLGQNTSPAAAWPRSFVKSMTRVYDFTAGSMRDTTVRMSAESPTVGPEQQTVTMVSGEHAWNMAGKDTVPRLFEASERAHQIVISPHGILRAAFANNAAVTKKTGPIVDAVVISGKDERDLLVISEGGQVIRTDLDSISVLGRATQGVRIMRFKKEADLVASSTVVDAGGVVVEAD